MLQQPREKKTVYITFANVHYQRLSHGSAGFSESRNRPHFCMRGSSEPTGVERICGQFLQTATSMKRKIFTLEQIKRQVLLIEFKWENREIFKLGEGEKRGKWRGRRLV